MGKLSQSFGKLGEKLLAALKKLLLVCGKNLLLRKHQWVVTSLEILMPIVLVLILASMTGEDIRPDKFETMDEKGIHAGVCICKYDPQGSNNDQTLRIVYTPVNSKTAPIMRNLQFELCSPCNKIFGVRNAIEIEGETNETNLEDRFLRRNYTDFLAAVVFPDGLVSTQRSGSSNQGLISYKIRMSEHRSPDTRKLYLSHTKVGPHLGNYRTYRESGFLAIQLSLDKAITQELAGKPINREVSLTPSPYPPYFHNLAAKEPNMVLLAVGPMLCFAYLFMVVILLRNMLTEKQSGVKELLKLTGVPTWIQWTAWFINSLVPLTVVITICTGLMYTYVKHAPLLLTTSFSVMWVVFFLYTLSSISFTFFVGSLFENGTVAMSINIVANIATSFLFFVPIRGTKGGVGVSVFPNTALGYAMLLIANQESIVQDSSDLPIGAQWSNLNKIYKRNFNDWAVKHVKTDMSLQDIMLMMLGDTAIYMLLAMYFDSVLPTEHGVSRPWYLFQCNRDRSRNLQRVAPTGASDIPNASLPQIEEVGSVAVAEPSVKDSKPDQGASESKPGLKEPSTISPSTTDKSSVQDPNAETSVNVEEPEVDPIMEKILQSFEPEPENAVVGIEIRDVHKHFTSGCCGCRKRNTRPKLAVNGVSLRMFAGDIFALLGHNGAGKTTLISMITGFFSPTRGSILVNGCDVKYDLEKARRSMGYCAQKNIIFERLTFSEQLRFIGMLRGLSWNEAKQEARMWMNKMNLPTINKVQSRHLSGGQKRKLCLCMSLIGGTKVVILDEPSSGLDPQSRRELWDIILGLREGRTILFTTHHMEEADVLGDRIAIMCEGELYCCGSVTFLKQCFGFGCTLKIVLSKPLPMPEPPPPPTEAETASNKSKSENEEQVPPMMQEVFIDPVTAELLAFTKKHISTAYLKPDVRRRKNNEVYITLPSDTTTSASLTALFSAITKNKEKLDIHHVELVRTTMDEVFIQVGQLADQRMGVVPYQWSLRDFAKVPKNRGCRKFIDQFTALMYKRFIFSLRQWIISLFEVTFFVFVSLLLIFLIHYTFVYFYNIATKFAKDSADPTTDPGFRQLTVATSTFERVMTLNAYKSPVTICSSEDPSSADILSYLPRVIKPTYNGINDYRVNMYYRQGSKTPDEISKVGVSNLKAYKYQYILAATVDKDNFSMFFNPVPIHAAPLSINVATNTLLMAQQSPVRQRIQVSSHPFWDPNGTRLKIDEKPPGRPESRALDLDPAEVPDLLLTTIEVWILFLFPGLILSFIILLGPLLLTSTFVRIPVEERLCHTKRLQLMTGVHPAFYWLTMFLYDYTVYFLCVCVIVAGTFMIEWVGGRRYMTVNDGAFALFVILMAYGYSAITFVYLISLQASSAMGGFSSAVFNGFVTGYVTPLVMNAIFPINTFAQIFFGRFNVVTILLKFVPYLFPTFPALECLSAYFAYATRVAGCPILKEMMGSKYRGVDLKCNENSFFKFTRKHVSLTIFNLGESTTANAPGVLLYVIFMLCNGLCYTTMLMLIEYGIMEKLCRRFTKEPAPVQLNYARDEDVIAEQTRVNMLLQSGQVATNTLVVQGLTKSFGQTTAVSMLSFGVNYGETFGLLGVNGAGKTTAFRMITGDITPSSGNAFGFGASLDNKRREFFENFGYTPQFDASFEIFTGIEMLQLFAMLRGIPRMRARAEALKWLQRMDLVSAARLPCRRYSGGMRRRLSIAMAMIGDAALLLLDEPTSGVDPVNRQKFWTIVEVLRDFAGQSIILTSHSMEECEALCGRLGIMVNGQFQCFGDVDHLKRKFAQGYSLSIWLTKPVPDETHPDDQYMARLAQLHEKFVERFGETLLKDKHRTLLQYYIMSPETPLDVMYQTMEEIKGQFKDEVDEYILNETTLEEVFLALAREQRPENKIQIDTGPCLRCRRCCL